MTEWRSTAPWRSGEACSCGMCPSFSARSFAVERAVPDEPPACMPGDGHYGDWCVVCDADGRGVASVNVRALEDGSIDFDIAPFEEDLLALEGHTFDFTSAPIDTRRTAVASSRRGCIGV